MSVPPVLQQAWPPTLRYIFPGLALIAGIAFGIIFSRFVESDVHTLRVSKFGNVTSLTVDATERSILTTETGVCSEPVPDVVGKAVTDLVVGGGYENAKAQLRDQQKADALSLYSRSQGIQILRDGMYRLCEAHMNGAIGKEIYAAQVLALTQSLNWLVTLELCSRPVHDLLSASGDLVKSTENSGSSTLAKNLLDACLGPSIQVMKDMNVISAALATAIIDNRLQRKVKEEGATGSVSGP